MSYLDYNKELANYFKTALGEDYEIELDKELKNIHADDNQEFSIIIYYKQQILVAIKVLHHLFNTSLFDTFTLNNNFMLSKLKGFSAQFYVYYMGKDNIFLYDTDSNGWFRKLPLDDVIYTIKSKRISKQHLKPNEISDILKSKFKKANEKIKILSEDIEKLFDEKSIVYDYKEGEVFLNTAKEDEFFKLFLPKQDVNVVCRYTSVDSLFKTLQKRNHCMLTIPCMNDKGELTYSDRQVGRYSYPPSKLQVKEDNDCFILSCCDIDKKDNLTMWRLYGDNAKGACLIYEIDKKLIDNKRFFFAPVSYADNEDGHYILEFIKEMMQTKFNDWRFVFKRWYIWKHFFKSYIFKDEQEIRLMYIPDEKDKDFEWIRDNSNGIISRIKTFGINDSTIKFPLTLKKVIIGPKCNEIDSVVSQLNYMNDCQGVMDNKYYNPVIKSEIEDYR